MPSITLPAPVMAFAIEPKAKGDEDKVFTALRRLQEEDPTIDLHRDDETGEQIVAGLSQIHVEVVVDRLKSRFGAEVTLKPPRVPYQETIRGTREGPRAPQEAVRRPRPVRRLPHRDRAARRAASSSSSTRSRAASSRRASSPRSRRAWSRRWRRASIAGYPLKGIRVRLFDGSYHTVDSSEMAFKIAGSMAMKQAVEAASPVLLEPIMLVTASVPDSAVGDVMGDLSSRRGRPLGTENVGGMTEVKAEVPMAELLTYAPDLRSITGGQGEYTLEFVRYEEVPAHLAQKIVQEHEKEEEAVKA